MQGKSGMKEPVIHSDMAGRIACPPGANSALWTSFLYTRDMWKVLSCCKRVLNDDQVRLDSCRVVRREGFWLSRLFLLYTLLEKTSVFSSLPQNLKKIQARDLTLTAYPRFLLNCRQRNPMAVGKRQRNRSMMRAMATVQNRVFDAYDIENFIVGSRKQIKDASRN